VVDSMKGRGGRVQQGSRVGVGTAKLGFTGSSGMFAEAAAMVYQAGGWW
jgi:hypothetical protein